MTPAELLNDLENRGVRVWPDGDRVKLTAPRGVLTDADYAEVRTHKGAILALISRPALGTIRRPLTVRGSRLAACPFDGCAGEIAGHENANLKLCKKCGWYFELLPPMTGESL